MSDLMDHPFITSQDRTEDGEPKLTVLNMQDFHAQVLRVSEVGAAPFEFTTMESF